MSTLESGWYSFLSLCLSAKKQENLAALFDLMLTPEEKTNLATRCLIIQALLKEEKPQREMAKDLNVSIAKITRGSNELKRINEKLLEFLRKELLC